MKDCLVFFFLVCGCALGQGCAPAGALPANSTLNGALTAANCALPDGTLYADYLVVFPVHGSWTGVITAADGITPLNLILRDAAGTQIYSGGVVQGAVERGAYHVLVNGPAIGFQLASMFNPASNVLCWNYPFIGTIRAINGFLGPASCMLPDNSAYDGYQLTLYGSGTVDIAVNSAAFTPLLILRTADGYALSGQTSTDANGATHLTVDAVGNDTYTLIVAVSTPDQAGGAYSVNATFTPQDGETCVSQGALSATQQVNGSISPLTCNFNLPGRQDNALFNFYNVHLDQAGVIQASLPASDFSGLLLLLDADGNSIAQDVESGANGTPLIERQLAPGDYLLAVFNEDSFGGNYTVNYQYTAGPGAVCPVVSMNPGDMVPGTLTGGVSCADHGYLSDAYQIVVPSDGSVSLILSSPDFSALVDLHDAKDNELTWGLESADGSGSFLNVKLPAGTYFVHAASLDLPGGYTLSYTFTPGTLPACPAATSLPANGYIQNAQLGPASCLGKDGRISDYYRFTLAAPSTEAVFLLSPNLPPLVSLLAADGTPLRSDQTSYVNNNSVIVQYLPAGNYLAKAQSSDPNATGLYSLYLNDAPGVPQLCAPFTLPINTTLSGQTSFTSCAWPDKTFTDVYELNITSSSQQVSIGAQSAAFDAFLILMDAKGNVLATDDNSGGGSNPLITQVLDPGIYFLAVKPANDPASAGSYSLTTSATSVAASDQRHRKK